MKGTHESSSNSTWIDRSWSHTPLRDVFPLQDTKNYNNEKCDTEIQFIYPELGSDLCQRAVEWDSAALNVTPGRIYLSFTHAFA